MGGWTPRMRWLRVCGFAFFRLSDSEHPQNRQRHSGRDTGDEVPVVWDRRATGSSGAEGPTGETASESRKRHRRWGRRHGRVTL